MAAQLCRTRLHPAAEIERLLHDACALFAGNEGAAAQLAGPGGGGQPELDAWLTALVAHGVLLAPAQILQDVIAQSPLEYPGLALQQACQETLTEHEIRFPATFSSDEALTQDDVVPRTRVRSNTMACTPPSRPACCAPSPPTPMS